MSNICELYDKTVVVWMLTQLCPPSLHSSQL
jgi:hypothetical protein